MSHNSEDRWRDLLLHIAGYVEWHPGPQSVHVVARAEAAASPGLRTDCVDLLTADVSQATAEKYARAFAELERYLFSTKGLSISSLMELEGVNGVVIAAVAFLRYALVCFQISSYTGGHFKVSQCRWYSGFCSPQILEIM